MPSRHLRAASSVSVCSCWKPISAANRSAPSPTSIRCWGSRSITSRAIEIGWAYPRTAATAPAARVRPSMIDASSSTTPSRFGRPPMPTQWSSGLDSTSRTAASTASSAVPPERRISIPAGRPTSPRSLAIMTEPLIAGRLYGARIDRACLRYQRTSRPSMTSLVSSADGCTSASPRASTIRSASQVVLVGSADRGCARAALGTAEQWTRTAERFRLIRDWVRQYVAGRKRQCMQHAQRYGPQ
jgi:hypothetical protein